MFKTKAGKQQLLHYKTKHGRRKERSEQRKFTHSELWIKFKSEINGINATSH